MRPHSSLKLILHTLTSPLSIAISSIDHGRWKCTFGYQTWPVSQNQLCKTFTTPTHQSSIHPPSSSQCTLVSYWHCFCRYLGGWGNLGILSVALFRSWTAHAPTWLHQQCYYEAYKYNMDSCLGRCWWASSVGSQTQKGIITYAISANRQRPLAGTAHAAVFNSWRRFRAQALYVIPPFAIAYLTMNWAIEKYVSIDYSFVESRQFCVGLLYILIRSPETSITTRKRAGFTTLKQLMQLRKEGRFAVEEWQYCYLLYCKPQRRIRKTIRKLYILTFAQYLVYQNTN